jgi:hypothetical protein
MQKDNEYLNLLRVFVRIVEANKGTPAGQDDRILDAEGLALKFFGHSSTAFYIYRGTVLPDLGANFVDSASINVLGRAALETFLVFHYVFVAPKSEEERNFRYTSWLLAGLIERQTFPIQSPKGKEMLSKERELISPLQAKLKRNAQFRALTQRQQKDLLEKGQWKLHSWKEIALSAGLGHTHAEALYHYLCGYAHAGNLSILQIRKVETPQSQRSLCAPTITTLMISTANMIRSYCKIFPKSESVLHEDPDGAALVEIWINVGSTPTESIKVDWEKEGLAI